MKKAGALFFLLAAMLVAIPAYNTAIAAERGMPADREAPRGEMRPGPGWQHPEISPEKQAAFDKIATDFEAKMRPLRNDMWAKRTELDYLARTSNADAKAISKLVGELKNLREKAQALQAEYAAKLSKDLGITNNHACSLLGWGGRGHGGYGHGAYGHRGYGYDCGCGGYDGDGPGPRGMHNYEGGHRGRHMRGI